MATNLLLFLPFLLLLSSAAGHNITKILSQFSDYSTFNSLLTQTLLASEINSRQTITVLAVTNSALSSVSGQPSDVVKKVLSLHVVLDYYDQTKLEHLDNKSVILTTLYQTTGLAVGRSGFLNVTDTSDGQIAFGSAVAGASLDSHLVKVVASQPYNISVLEISGVIQLPANAGGSSNQSSTPAQAPAPSSAGSSSAPAPSAVASPPPSHSKSPAPAATTAAPAQPPKSSSPQPPKSSSPQPPKPSSPQPPKPSSPPESSELAPAPVAGGPVLSPPAPPVANPPASGTPTSFADAPGPTRGAERDGTSGAGRMAAGAGFGAGIAVAMGAAFLSTQ